ncbi:MAG: acylneuraminate cytidylyltransferase family protein [Desulfobacter sp.]
MYVVAVIPAKMTSQRFRRKNLRELCGKPLIYYSIEVAKNVNLIADVFVSSEDAEMQKTALKYGARIIERPGALSDPKITNQDVLKHAYEHIGQKNKAYPDIMVLLQPTHPLRDPNDIENALQVMADNREYDSLFSVMKTDELRGRIIKKKYVPEFSLPRKKAEEPDMYKNTGSFYLFRPETSFLTKSFFGDKIYPFKLQRSPFEIDIDYSSDMEMAECLLDRNLEIFPHFDV